MKIYNDCPLCGNELFYNDRVCTFYCTECECYSIGFSFKDILCENYYFHNSNTIKRTLNSCHFRHRAEYTYFDKSVDMKKLILKYKILL